MKLFVRIVNLYPRAAHLLWFDTRLSDHNIQMGSKQQFIKLPKASSVPNSIYPVIHYRNVLPNPDDHDAVRALLQGNGFLVYGYYGHIGLKHYHSNTHECYCIVNGSSTFVLGRGPDDDTSIGKEVQVEKGDVLILPVSPLPISLGEKVETNF